MKKIILVTGSSGLVGLKTLKFFLKKNFTVIGIDNDKRSYFLGKMVLIGLKKIN